MPNIDMTSGHPSTSSDSFEQELTELLRTRTRLMLWVVLVVAGIATIAYGFILKEQPVLQGGLLTTGVDSAPTDEEGLPTRGISRFIFEP